MSRVAINIDGQGAASSEWTPARTAIWLLLLTMLSFWGTLVATSGG